MASVWLACGLLTANPGAVAAQMHAPTAAAPSPAPRQVVLGLAGAAPGFAPASLRDVLAGYLADLEPARVAAVEPLPPGDEILPRLAWARDRARDPASERVLWLELREPGPHRLYLYDPRTDRVYLRELADAEPDLLLESVGVVVRTLVATLSEGPPAGMQPVTLPPPPPPEPAPKPKPAPVPAPKPAPAAAPRPAPAPLHLDLALGYRGSSFGRAIALHHGFAGQLLLATPRGLLVGLTAGYLAPGTAPALSGLRLELARVPLAARIGVRLRRDRALHVDLDLGLAAELLLPRVRSDRALLSRTGVIPRLGLAPGVGLGLRPFRRVPLGLHLHLQLDVWLRDVALAVRRPDGDVVLADAAPVGATFDLALRYTFGAPPR